MKVCTRMSWLNEYGWVQVKFASRFMTCYNQGMKVKKRAYHKRKDDSVRDNQTPVKDDTVCHIQPSDIAMITKAGQIVLKFTPREKMTKQQREYYARGWEGKYNKKVKKTRGDYGNTTNKSK